MKGDSSRLKESGYTITYGGETTDEDGNQCVEGDIKKEGKSNKLNFKLKGGEARLDVDVEILDETKKEVVGSEVITAKEIAENPSENFGKVVTGYECKSDGVKEWKIFYADNNNIYLIASDYLHNNDVPNGKGDKRIGMGYTDTANDCVIYFYASKPTGPYKGSVDVVREEIKELNSIYYNYLEKENVTDTSESAKLMACLLDEDVWNVFKGTNADFAVGGPTLELFIKSYNEKYGESFQARVNEKLEYEVSYDGGRVFSYGDSKQVDTITNDALYDPKGTEACQMYLASVTHDCDPDYSMGYSLFVVGEYGVYGYSDLDYCGLRPIVRLSSEVRLVKDGENFSIVK